MDWMSLVHWRILFLKSCMYFILLFVCVCVCPTSFLRYLLRCVTLPRIFFSPEAASLMLHNFCIYHINPPGHEVDNLLKTSFKRTSVSTYIALLVFMILQIYWHIYFFLYLRWELLQFLPMLLSLQLMIW